VIRLRAYRGSQMDTTECFNGLRDEAADALERAEAERDALKRELREIGVALNDPADNNTETTAQCVTRLRKECDAYRWTLMELRANMHAAGLRPETCHDMSLIDAALAAKGE
jgi:hypothetical protein